MINYIKLNITKIDNKFVYSENNDIGEYFKYLKKDKNNFVINEINKCYICNYKNEFESIDIIFLNKKERNLFSCLIKIPSIGFKMAVTILNEYSFDEFYKIIIDNNLENLAKIDGIGNITAKKIIFYMNKTLFNIKLNKNKKLIIKSLEKMNFKTAEILNAFKNVKSNSIEDMTKEVLLNIGYEKNK